MRYFSSALCVASLIGLVGCSTMNSGSSGSSLPNTGSSQSAPNMRDRAIDWTPVNSAGWPYTAPRPNDLKHRPPQTGQRGGYYASEFRSDIGVFGYAPKPNKAEEGPKCTPPGYRYNVNGIAADEKGNLIVPGSSKPGGKNTKYWNVTVYQGGAQPTICGPALGTIHDYTGQPVDAASFNAQIAPIAVSEINFTTKLGEVVICTLASLSCSAPVTSTAITGYSAGVAIDASGDCWLSTAKKTDNGIPSGFRLIYWAGCTGNGVAATGTTGQSSYGGLFIDNAGHLGAFDAFGAKLFVYSGCKPACTQIGKFALQGQSFYGGLNGAGTRLAVGDVTNGSVDVYNYYSPSAGVTYHYSFDTGLKHARLVESGIFSPANQRLHS
jgi:hypothetical protein